MIEIVAYNKKTGRRFGRMFESPIKAKAYKMKVLYSKRVGYIGWWNF